MENCRPKIFISTAISIDGKIATRKLDSKLSSMKDLKKIHKLRSSVDAILIGKNTAMIDNPLLTVRHVKGKNPLRIILSSRCELSADLRIIQSSREVPTLIVHSSMAPKKNIKNLQKYHIQFLSVGKTKINLKKMLKKLYERGIRSILVEGGSTVNWSFISQNLFDELYITITPFIVGGKDSIPFVGGEGFDKILNSPKLEIVSIKKSKNEILLKYKKL